MDGLLAKKEADQSIEPPLSPESEGSVALEYEVATDDTEDDPECGIIDRVIVEMTDQSTEPATPVHEEVVPEIVAPPLNEKRTSCEKMADDTSSTVSSKTPDISNPPVDNAECSSGTTCWTKCLCSIGHGMAVGAFLTAFVHAPKIYVTNFRADPVCLGIVIVLAALYDAVNVGPIAQWSDRGVLNGTYFPMQSWGRRAPFSAVGTPVFMLGGFICWVGARPLSSVMAALWLGLGKTVVASGSTFYFMASTASLFEIFPEKKERVVVTSLTMLCVLIASTFSIVIVASIVFSVDPADTETQDQTFFMVGMLAVIMVVFTVPHTSIMRKTKVWEISAHPGLWCCIKETFKNQTFRKVVLAKFFFQGALQTCMALLPFFVQHACDISTTELGVAVPVIMAAHLVSRVLLLTPQSFLVRKYDPARLSWISIVACVIATAPLCILSVLQRRWQYLIIVASILGANFGILDLSFKTLLGWVVDEDQVLATEEGRQNGDPGFLAPRRDGIFWGAYAFAETIGQLYVGFGTALFGACGYISHLDTIGERQPESAVLCIIVYFIGVITVNQLLAAAMLRSFPLQGERLRDMETKYKANFNTLQARE